MQQGVSVLICCYNSAKRLHETLHHLVNQKTDTQLPWEVVLIDNNSSDNTAEVALTEWEKYKCPIPFIVVKQPLPGLSHAREKGLETAKYEYIIFCDDDNWLDADYIQKSFDIFNQNTEVGIIGARSTGSFEVTPPPWFEQYHGYYAIGGKKETGIHKWVAGAGMCLRKQLFRDLLHIGFRPLLSGRKGKKLSSGEDIELCYVANLLGYKIYYTSDLHLTHFMTAQRLTWDYCKRLITEGICVSQVFIDIYDIVINGPEDITPEKVYSQLLQKTKKNIQKRLKNFVAFAKFGKAIFIKRPGNNYKIKTKFDINQYLFVLFNKKLILNSIVQTSELNKKVKEYRLKMLL